MKRMKQVLFLLLLPMIVAIIVYAGLSFSLPKAEPLLKPVTVVQDDTTKKGNIYYIAIGDSLTEGVGDQTKQGGFVPLVASDLKDRYQLTAVEVENYGVNGERSDQILKRLKKEKKIQKNVASADFITLTVGGNDLMKVIQDHFFELRIDSFKKPLKNYQKNVNLLIEELRALNAKAPIYVLGIYNPFYLDFPKITDMQTIVDNWNKGTETIVKKEPNCYFIPINDLLYQGLDNEVGVTAESGTQTENSGDDLNQLKNNVLYEEDHFHPNNLGYQLMANAVRDQLIKTQEKWLLKETMK